MKPILFNTDMVRAILDNRKKVTRRVVKPQAVHENGFWKIGGAGWSDNIKRITPVLGHSLYYRAPYRPGDILYVRETFFNYGGKYIYRADVAQSGMWDGMWHPSIHMPREAARIFLRVTDVRVERLQDIDDDGIFREGAAIRKPYSEIESFIFRSQFKDLWNSTIKPAGRAIYGWIANPWVWVIEFDRISREEAENAK